MSPPVDADLADRIARLVVDVEDYPSPGIVYKDLTPLLADGPAFAATAAGLLAAAGTDSFDVVAGVEARGFLFAAAVALLAGVGVVPVRKAGKLPRETVARHYCLEYGEATLEVHADAVGPGQRVLLVDDVLATGGTLSAARDLVLSLGARVTGVGVVLEIAALGGRVALDTSAVGVRALLTV